MKCSAAQIVSPCEFPPVRDGLCRTHLRSRSAPRLVVVEEAPHDLPVPGESEMVASVEAFIHKFVRKHLFRISDRGALTYDDLMCAGRMGALTAARRFDPSVGAKYMTYASYWIEHAIRREIEDIGKTIRVPSYQFQRAVKGIAKESTLVRLGKNGGVVSFDIPLKDGSDGSLLDLLADDRALADEALIENEESNSNNITAAIESLRDKRERFVIRHRFYGDMTLDEIGKKLGISKERVRQIEVRALEKLRVKLEDES